MSSAQVPTELHNNETAETIHYVTKNHIKELVVNAKMNNGKFCENLHGKNEPSQ
jgi:hypothetical protein